MDEKPFRVQLAQAEAALVKQTAALETARRNLARTRPLVKRKALSQKDLEKGRTGGVRRAGDGGRLHDHD